MIYCNEVTEKPGGNQVSKSNTIELTAKLVHILELLFESQEEVGIRELARLCDMPKSTVERLVHSLADVQWVIQNPKTKKFRIGLRLLQLTNRWHLNMELVRLISPVMEDLVVETNLTAIITVLDGDKGRCINKFDSKQAIKLVSTVGATIPLHAGASGKALLAFLPQTEIDRILSGPLKTFTSNTTTDPAVLNRQLKEIREKGFVVSIEEVDDGAAAIGVPIFDIDNSVLASLSIAGSKFDMIERSDHLIPIVVETATKITKIVSIKK